MARGKVTRAETQRRRGVAACPHAAEGGVLATKNTETTKAMKPSGVTWLGDIPDGWELRRGKYLLSQISEPSSSQNKVALENIESGTGKYIDSNAILQGNGIAFTQGDILYGKLRPYLAKVWLAEFEGNAVGDFFVYRVAAAYYNCYAKYVMLAPSFTAITNDSTYGAKMPRVSAEFIANLRFPLPPLPEQRSIADYLDEKCGAIDAAIAEVKNGIEEYKAWKKSLIFEAVTGKRRVGIFNAETQSRRERREAEKMKPSGIPWIGEIPEGWEVVKGKYLLSANSGIALRNELLINIGNYPVFGGGEVIGYTDNWNCDAKTILIGRVGARCGCVTLLNDKSWATDNALIVSTNEEPRYLSYLLIGADLNQYNSSNAQPLITAGRIRNLMFPYVDDKREQQAIADYLDEKCAAIDALVAEKEALIADLESYKKSLIFELVTGKREVA